MYIKTHKDPVTARPIVEKMCSPTYHIEKHLAKWCLTFLNPYQFSVFSPNEFLDKFRGLRQSSGNDMTILDFESLYHSLNLNAICLVFYRFLIEHTPVEQRDLELLREIAYLICHNSFFFSITAFTINNSKASL